MKITATIETVMVAMAAVAGLAQAGEVKQTVTVYMTNEHVAMTSASFAKQEASRMFAAAGITLQWRGMGRSPLPADAIVVDMVQQGAESRCPGALACAAVYEGVHIQVFFDRMQQVVPKNVVPALLAHVLVHEITHILQGASRHSENGVMKATWGAKDYAQMSRKALTFTDTDVLLIRRGLVARQAMLMASVASEGFGEAVAR
jgi:hypothetical protein